MVAFGMCRSRRSRSKATTTSKSDALEWAAETSVETSNAGLDGFNLLLEVVKETSDSILPLKAVAAGALAIIQLSRAYKSNRKEWIRFANLVAEHVAVILRRISEIPKESVSLSLSEDVMALLRTMHQIHNLIEGQLGRPRWQRVLQSRSEPQMLASLRVDLQDAYNRFFVTSYLAPHAAPALGSAGTGTIKVPDIPMIPETSTELYGRDEYISNIIDLITALDSGSSRAHVMIYGPGGVGKTSTARAILHHERAKEVFSLRRYFVSCETAETPGRLLTVIAQSLQIEITTRDVFELIMSHLRNEGGSSLMVLDNFETCWYSRHRHMFQQVLQHIASLKTITVILTTRTKEHPLGIRWHPIPALDVLDLKDARAAFFAAATAVTAEEDERLLNELLQDLGGLPLAIGLLANLVCRGESIADLYQRFTVQKTSLLTVAHATGSPSDRHYDLDLSIELSIRSPPMRNNPKALRLLQVLSLLPDGLSSYSFEKVHLFSQSDRYRARDVLSSIGLAFIDGSKTLKALPPIRLHVTAHYPVTEEDVYMINQHHVELASLAEDAMQAEVVPDNLCDLLRLELGNMCSILPRILSFMAVDSGSKDIREPAWAILSLTKFLHWSWLPSAEILQYVLDNWKTRLPLEYQAAYLQMHGVEHHVLNNCETAARSLAEAQEIHHQLGDVAGEATCQWTLGDMLRAQARYTEAIAKVEYAMKLYASIDTGDLRRDSGIVICTWSLADILHSKGELKEALEKVESTLGRHIKRRSKGECGAIILHILKQVITISQGHYHEAEISLETLLSTCIKLKDVHDTAVCQCRIAEACFLQGKLEKAYTYAKAGYEAFQSQGGKQGAADCQCWLGLVACERGETEEASRLLWETSSAYRELGDRLHIAMNSLCEARVARASGKLDEADETGKRALLMLEDLGNRRGMAFAHLFLAQLCRDRGDLLVARTHAREAEETFSYLGNETEIKNCRAAAAD